MGNAFGETFASFGGLSPKSRFLFSFFLSGFSFKDTDKLTLKCQPHWWNTLKQFVGKNRLIVWVCLTILWVGLYGSTGRDFIPLYNFHLLTNMQAFICSFACEITTTYFYWDIPPCWINIRLIGVNFCLLTWPFLFIDLTCLWTSAITLALQANRLTKYASHFASLCHL